MSNCKLISYTQPAISEVPDSESLVAYTARVSNPANQNNWETSTNLVKWLVNNHHWSPLEMVSVCIEIDTTRAISAQILRHRSFQFQEFSQRYSKPEVNYPDLRERGSTNRQGSLDNLASYKAHELSVNAIDTAYDAYHLMIEEGVALESARMVLPMCTKTTIYMQGSLRSWIHYIQLRAEEHTQKEHRIIALEIKDIITGIYPNIMEVL